LGPEAARVTDKLPTNYLHLGLIATLFPRARVIHCTRDARDTCLSCYSHNFRLAYTNSLEDLAFAYQEYERLMTHWRNVLPLQIHDISYEQLVTEPEPVCRGLIEFCGLPWDERCLAFHENRRTVNSPSAHQVRKPLYQSAVSRWKCYEKHLGQLFEALK
jgi:hypothetical protein